jgi:hypothetical protein
MLRAGVTGFACVLLIAGCGTTHGAHRTAATAPPSTAPPASPSVPPSSAPPTSATLPPAANGTNVNACAQGQCEILVTGPVAIPVDPATTGVASLAVSDISPDGVDFLATTSDGTTTNMLGQLPDQGGPSQVNHLAVLVVAYTGRAAVIRLSRA